MFATVQHSITVAQSAYPTARQGVTMQSSRKFAKLCDPFWKLTRIWSGTDGKNLSFFARTMQKRYSTISVSEAARDLGLTPQGVRDLIRGGKLRARKNQADRWRIDGDSLAGYLSEHGARKGASAALERLEGRISALERRIASLPETASTLATVEKERDQFRSKEAALREAMLLHMAAGEDIDAAFRKQREAFAQVLRPGSIEDLTPARGRARAD